MKKLFLFYSLFIILLKTAFIHGNKSLASTAINRSPNFASAESFLFATETSYTADREQVPCNYVRGLVVGDRKRELQCCNSTVDRYRNQWLSNSLPLNRYLETLKEWNCPQFQLECDERLFDFNKFTGLMYDFMCSNSTFFEKCLSKLENTTKTAPYVNISMNRDSQTTASNSSSSTIALVEDQWKKVVAAIHPAQMTIEELLEPCMQVAQYAQSDGKRIFQEVIDFGIPSCGISWCGFGAEAIRAHEISVSTCLEPSCRSRVIVIMVAFGILGLLITAANVLIILILCLKAEGRMPLLRNSQALYKLSLAVADLLVGVIVLPICVVNLYAAVWTRHLPRDELRSVKGFEVINGTISKNVTVVQLESLAGRFDTKFSSSYVNFAGFFTAVSIFVSVYMLAGAGFDRLNAVAKPFTYKKRTAFRAATKACVAFWMVAVVFGILPVFISELKFVFVLSILFATLELFGYILYVVFFFIPLVIVWVVNLLTYYHSIKHANFRQSLTQPALRKRESVERRLASTLRLMVGIFTFNTLPLLISLVFPLFIPSILPNTPRYFDPTSSEMFLTIQFVAIFLLFGNSLCNFFIYSARNREFRRSLKLLFGRIGKITKFSFCLKHTNVCCHNLSRHSSTPLSARMFTRSRTSTGATPTSQVDLSVTRYGSPENSSMFTLSMSSRNGTPKLNQKRRNRHDGVATNVGDVSNKRKSKGFSITLESVNEDSVFGTPGLEPKRIDGFTFKTDHSTDTADNTKSENDIL